MKKIDSKELKSPDKLQQELQKGFQWTTQHSKLVGLLLLGFFVLGAGISAKSYMDEKKETELQTEYYQAEKKLFEQKASFETAVSEAANPPAKKKEDAEKKTPPAAKASGDFEKDYGPIAAELLKVIEKAPKSKAAKMAALNLSDIQLEYNKPTEALETLKRIDAGSKDLLSGMIQTQLGTVQANMDDCNSALNTWSSVFNNAGAKPLHSAVKLKAGLCYEAMKDLGKAEQAYNEVKNEDKESEAARSADKYLRLLQTAKK